MAHKIKILLLLLLFYTAASSQQLTPRTINAAGQSRSNGGIMLEDAVGGLLVTTISTSTFMYTQDFLQPDKGISTGPIYINDVVLGSGSSFGFDNAGTTFIVNNTMLEFTVGEFACITLNSANNKVTQGILQPYLSLGNLWTGLINTDWFNTGNWASGLVPVTTTDVIIPGGCPNYPVISNGQIANCKSINVLTGSSVTVDSGGHLKISLQQNK